MKIELNQKYIFLTYNPESVDACIYFFVRFFVTKISRKTGYITTRKHQNLNKT